MILHRNLHRLWQVSFNNTDGIVLHHQIIQRLRQFCPQTSSTVNHYQDCCILSHCIAGLSGTVLCNVWSCLRLLWNSKYPTPQPRSLSLTVVLNVFHCIISPSKHVEIVTINYIIMFSEVECVSKMYWKVMLVHRKKKFHVEKDVKCQIGTPRFLGKKLPSNFGNVLRSWANLWWGCSVRLVLQIRRRRVKRSKLCLELKSKNFAPRFLNQIFLSNWVNLQLQ